jgi:hypothetical protein
MTDPAPSPTLPAGKILFMRGKLTAIAGVVVVLAGCGGADHTATTVTSTVPPVTQTVTVTVTPPPPPGPKTTMTTTGDVIDNNISDGQQVVRILPTDTAFMTRGCGTWTKIG